MFAALFLLYLSI